MITKVLCLLALFSFSSVAMAQEETLKSTQSVFYNKKENEFRLTTSLRVPAISKETHMLPMVGAAFENSLVSAPVDYVIGFETLVIAHKAYAQAKFGHWYSQKVKLHSGIESDFIISSAERVHGGFSIGPFVEAEFSDVAVQMAAIGSRWDDFELSMRLAYKL